MLILQRRISTYGASKPASDEHCRMTSFQRILLSFLKNETKNTICNSADNSVRRRSTRKSFRPLFTTFEIRSLVSKTDQSHKVASLRGSNCFSNSTGSHFTTFKKVSNQIEELSKQCFKFLRHNFSARADVWHLLAPAETKINWLFETQFETAQAKTNLGWGKRKIARGARYQLALVSRTVRLKCG